MCLDPSRIPALICVTDPHHVLQLGQALLQPDTAYASPRENLAESGFIVVYGNLQAASTNLYKKKDGTDGKPTGRSASLWAGWCSLIPLITAM